MGELAGIMLFVALVYLFYICCKVTICDANKLSKKYERWIDEEE